MKAIAKIYCFFFRHEFVDLSGGGFDNGSSKYGEQKCVRCGFHYKWQYDYLGRSHERREVEEGCVKL